MVLNKHFPPNSTERSRLILQLKVDVRKALASISKVADIEITALANGSLIIYFHFVPLVNTTVLEQEYLRQVDNSTCSSLKKWLHEEVNQVYLLPPSLPTSLAP